METKRPTIILVNRCFIMNDQREILIIKRQPNDRKNSNKWEVPGGKLDEGENLIVSKKREIMEETGLVIEQINPLIFAHSYVIEDGGYAGFTYISLFSINKLEKGEVTLSEEHTEFAWVGYEEMMESELTDDVRTAALALKEYLGKV